MTDTTPGELATGSELTKALVAVSAELPTIKAETAGQDGNRRYHYASLDQILGEVTPILAKHGLVLTHRVEAGELVTSLLHTSGEGLHSHIAIPPMTTLKRDDWKSFGAAVTYVRRYAVCAILSIAVDEDRDAQGAGAQEGPKSASKAASRTGQHKQSKPKPTNGASDTPSFWELDTRTLEIHQLGSFSGDAQRQASLVQFVKREIMEPADPKRAAKLVTTNKELIEALPAGCRTAIQKAYLAVTEGAA